MQLSGKGHLVRAFPVSVKLRYKLNNPKSLLRRLKEDGFHGVYEFLEQFLEKIRTGLQNDDFHLQGSFG